MNLREKRKQEQKNILEGRREETVSRALTCFCKKGIELTTMADIADYAQIGVATVYRYFSTKENLVMECGMLFWKLAGNRYKNLTEEEGFSHKTGLSQVESLLRITEDIFRENKLIFKFLHDFDVYISCHQIEQEKMLQYEALIDGMKPVLCDAIKTGKADGTIKSHADTQEIYYTLTHTVLSLMQKLAGLGTLLSTDGVVKDEKRLNLLITLLLGGLSQEKTHME